MCQMRSTERRSSFNPHDRNRKKVSDDDDDASRPAAGPTKCPVQGVLGDLSLCINPEADQSPYAVLRLRVSRAIPHFPRMTSWLRAPLPCGYVF